MIFHRFRKLNLARIYCGTLATSIGMQKLAKRLGMFIEGTRRQHHFLDSVRVDMSDNDILRPEFKLSLDLC